MISGKTTLIAHLGYPTFAFKAPLIYNPWFEKNGIDAVVVPMGVQARGLPGVLPAAVPLTNIRGALVTMPHKVTTIELVDELTPTALGRGGGNAVLLRGGRHAARRPVRRRRLRPRRRAQGLRCSRASGRSSSATAASARRSRPRWPPRASGRWACSTRTPRPPRRSASGCAPHYPALEVTTGSKDPEGYDIVVNATPLGMKDDDPLPMDVERIAPGTFVGEVVMKQEITPFLRGPGQGLPGPGRQRHAVRDDPGLPRVLRLRHRHPGRAAGGVPGRGADRRPIVEPASTSGTEVAPASTGWRCRSASTACPTVSAYLLRGDGRRHARRLRHRRRPDPGGDPGPDGPAAVQRGAAGLRQHAGAARAARGHPRPHRPLRAGRRGRAAQRRRAVDAPPHRARPGQVRRPRRGGRPRAPDARRPRPLRRRADRDLERAVRLAAGHALDRAAHPAARRRRAVHRRRTGRGRSCTPRALAGARLPVERRGPAALLRRPPAAGSSRRR